MPARTVCCERVASLTGEAVAFDEFEVNGVFSFPISMYNVAATLEQGKSLERNTGPLANDAIQKSLNNSQLG